MGSATLRIRRGPKDTGKLEWHGQCSVDYIARASGDPESGDDGRGGGTSYTLDFTAKVNPSACDVSERVTLQGFDLGKVSGETFDEALAHAARYARRAAWLLTELEKGNGNRIDLPSFVKTWPLPQPPEDTP